MRLLALSAATAIATMISFSVSAADIGYPPPVVGQDQYGVAPRPAVAPPQVIIIPAPPQYNGASVPPPGSGLPRMASHCRWLPGLTSSHAQRAPRFGAAGIAVAVGSRVAHRVLSTTRASMNRPIRRSTPAPAFRQRPSLTPARTRLRSTWVQTVRIRVIKALPPVTASRDSADQARPALELCRADF